MNAQAKRDLLQSLQLDRTPEPRKPGLTRVLAIVAVCALAGWVAAQFNVFPLIAAERDGAIAQSGPVSEPIPVSSIASTQPRNLVVTNASGIELQASGYITARQAATVSARTTAVVQAVLVEEGDFVLKDTVLARLDDRLQQAQYELAVSQKDSAEAHLAATRAEVDRAQRRLERVRSLAAAQLVSVAEQDDATTELQALLARRDSAKAQVETAQRQIQVHKVALQDYVIRAPFDGVVTQRSAQPGEIVSPMSAGGGFTRTGIATLVNMASLEVEVEVNETAINRVFIDQPVAIVLTAYPEVTYAGKVITIIPKGDRNKGTLTVRVGFMALKERDTRILPDMGARIDFLSSDRSEVAP